MSKFRSLNYAVPRSGHRIRVPAYESPAGERSLRLGTLGDSGQTHLFINGVQLCGSPVSGSVHAMYSSQRRMVPARPGDQLEPTCIICQAMLLRLRGEG